MLMCYPIMMAHIYLRSLHEPEHHDDTVDQDVYGL